MQVVFGHLDVHLLIVFYFHGSQQGPCHLRVLIKAISNLELS